MTAKPRRWSLVVYEKEVHDMENNKLKTTKVTKESVESTRRMLQLMNECEDAGVNTLRLLHTQGEALNRTEGTLEEIEMDLKDGDKTLKRISFMNKVPLILLPIYLMFKSKPPPTPTLQIYDDFDPQAQNTKNGRKSIDEPSISGSYLKRVSKSRWRGSKGKFVSLDDDLNLNKSTENTDRFFMKVPGDPDEEDEIESNLTVVSKHLSELKEHAILMGDTVTNQNSQLDRIHVKAENNQGKITAVNRRTRKLLGSDSSSDSVSISSPTCFRCIIS